MTVNFEVKKDGLRQTQDGIWKLTLTVLPEDMPIELMKAPMGSVYGLAMVPIDYDNPDARENRGTGKSEGEKVLALSHIRCKDKEFQAFIEKQSGLQNSGIRMKGEYQTAEQWCVTSLRDYCNIKSRSELTTDVAAQEKLRELDRKFKKWWAFKQWEIINQDNLNRED